MAITNYTELQSAISDWLDRTDLTAVIPTFISNAEGYLRRKPEVRNLVSVVFPVDTFAEELPADLKQIEEIYHAGPTVFGSIDVVSGSARALELGKNPSGPPRKATFVRDSGINALRFAPAPDQTYNLRLNYWQTVPALSAAAPTNWLLVGHADIYLYASLVESAPYLREDPRLAVWEQERDSRIEELNKHIEREQWGGSLVARSRRNIP